MTDVVKKSTELKISDKFLAKNKALALQPDILHTNHRVIVGDAREMKELIHPESIHLVVTSPPYWNLKDYEEATGDKQLGHIEDYKLFQDELTKVWRRCFNLLVPGGRLCIVIGDVCLSRKKEGRHYVIPLHADISVKCREIGFDYLTPILWYKIANAKTEVEGNGTTFLGKPYEPNGIIKNDIEYILLFRKPGAYRNPTQDQRILSLIEKDEFSKWFRIIWNDISGASRTAGHPAPFPKEIAYRLINMFSFVGDTVLDPFLGSGSTTEAAILSHRLSIGYDIEPKYIDITRRRLIKLKHNKHVNFSIQYD